MQMKATSINLSETERLASALGGALLAAYGISQRSKSGAMIAAAGGALIVRGATGFCPGYAAVGIDTRRSDTKEALAGSRGTPVETAVTIARPHDELYRLWRHFENLPTIMPHLVSVKDLGENRSHWIAKAPGGRTVEWDAEIINDNENELIGWRTLEGSDVVSAGSVRFKPTREGETMIRVHLQYEPPAGKVGATIAWLLGHEPSQTIREDLRRFKALMETGEVPTIEGQPRGRQSILNYD
ncbi:MAG TPA: YgaP-like transmembrane domain [Vicinamibacterales bacterium]|nr:YgaP-like transmembrane domain [Vicinamibacterales bacterium]